ncbi:N-alpha-acetyltransferase 30-like protein [Aduncisulcus paluster]|uniref:N-alpha-acetyltransferase 30-like protein n=1 Tax=Aduncisulcus paluster TaxID=2918883 RepID=A0ABQ5JTF9_9EUKA|nr:N-alpha-acetyltransferase 30-like protein [Aduncisulcus paluster]
MVTIEIRPYYDENDLDIMCELFATDLSEPYGKYTFRFFLERYPDISFVAEVAHDDFIRFEEICKKPEKSPKEIEFCTHAKYVIHEKNPSIRDETKHIVGSVIASIEVIRLGHKEFQPPAHYHHYVEQLKYKEDSKSSKGPFSILYKKLDSERLSSRTTGYIGMVSVVKEYRRLGIGKKLACISMNQMIRSKSVTEVYLETERHNFSAIKFYQSLYFTSLQSMSRYYLNGSSAVKMKRFFSDEQIKAVKDGEWIW